MGNRSGVGRGCPQPRSWETGGERMKLQMYQQTGKHTALDLEGLWEDDELGALYLDDRLDPHFMPVPEGQPRGPAGESAERDPVREPEGNAGDVSGGGDLASPLSSETESRAHGMEVPQGGLCSVAGSFLRWSPGLERGKDESERGKFSEESYLPKELLRGTEAAVHGMNAGKQQRMQGSTKAAAGRSARQRHAAVVVLFSAVLLSALLLACVAASWPWKKCLVFKGGERAAERAHPDTDWERVPSGDEGRAELGEATSEILAQANKNLSDSSSPFRSAIPEARDLQTHLKDLERELQAMKGVHGGSGECCFLSEDGPESESGGSAAERLSFTLRSPGRVSPVVRRLLARHSYDPFEGPNEDPESELPLTAGQHVYVFGDVDEDGWFLGELTDGTRGLVPSSLVTEVSDDELDTTMPPELCGLLLDTDDCVDAKSP
ncbi:uncharacterized protein LOC128072919 [Tympanuchus pallidicinctus]|uniref:uncharacterized protein LOC128072919 n=1 Tax=Tympanuchus pallidicinctus TaxID=109042 RepID=UPI00228750CC|nr:uncharacterized protein LOC128072919 [Tympanuchus pallidicinctus]